MTWYARQDGGAAKARARHEKTTQKVPEEGLWIRCDGCSEVILRREVERNVWVCPRCGFHFRLTGRARVLATLDEASFEEQDALMESEDPLNFRDSKRYKERIKATQKSTGEKDAFVWGYGAMEGRPVAMGAFEFSFQGGSMGSVVGEKISRMLDGAREHRCPCLLFSSSGGARMQEGILSLMQMAKTVAAREKLRDAPEP